MRDTKWFCFVQLGTGGKEPVRKNKENGPEWLYIIFRYFSLSSPLTLAKYQHVPVWMPRLADA